MGRSSFAAVVALLFGPLQLFAGSIFVSGHDSDYHASQGSNATGSQAIIQSALTYTRDGSLLPVLFLQSNLDNLTLGDHVNSEDGLIASGYTAGNTPGNHFVVVDDGAFPTINLSLFSAIFVPSDHGGTLTGNDLQALNARSNDIIQYLNAGGGLVAFAEDGQRTPATNPPQPTEFGFLPFLISSVPLTQFETGNVVTPFGQSLGLVNSDVNGNFSHNIFTSTGGLNIVDTDPIGQPLSLAFRGNIDIRGAVPEPGTFVLVGLAAAGLLVVALGKPRR
jgi:hypothetical protein